MSKLTRPKATVWKAAALAAGLGLAMISYPVHAAPATDEQPAAGVMMRSQVLQNRTVMDRNSIGVHNSARSASVIFPRPTGGITQIGVERLDFAPNTYVTTVTASGPTGDNAAMAVATLQTFTNLNQQTSFADTGSITLAYNQAKPSYVISELERAKLISPVEAQIARTAFDSLQARTVPTLAPGELSP